MPTFYDSCLMQEFLDFVLRQLIDFPDEMILTKLEANRKIISGYRFGKVMSER